MNKRQRKKFAKKYYQKRPCSDGLEYITEYQMTEALKKIYNKEMMASVHRTYQMLKEAGVLKVPT